MKIFYLLYSDASSQKGNASHVKGLIKSFSKLGHKVTIFSPGWPKELSKHAEHVYIPQTKFGGLYSLSYTLFLIPKLFMWLILNKPDVIYARYQHFSFLITYLTNLFNIPTIVEHNADIETEHKYYGRRRVVRSVLDICESSLLKQTGGSIVVTNSIVESWKKKYDINGLKHIELKNAVDVDIYKPPATNGTNGNTLNLPNNSKSIVYAGSMTEYQGLDILKEAFYIIEKEYPNVKLVIVGGEDKEVQKFRSDLKKTIVNKVINLGQLNESKTGKHISNANVCVAPYTSKVSLNYLNNKVKYGEPMKGDPLKIYSYLACKKPVVASHFREAGCFIESINAGIAVPPEDAISLANAILKLLNDQNLSETLGNNGFNYVVNNSTWDTVAKKTVNFIEEVKEYKF